MSPWCWSAPRLPPSASSMPRSASWSAAASVLPHGHKQLKAAKAKQDGWACAARWVIPPARDIPEPFRFAGTQGDKNGRGRKLEYRHDHADGRAQGDADV